MDYDYDSYEDELSEYEYPEGEEERMEMTFEQTIHNCVEPLFHQTTIFLQQLILWNLVFRVTTQIVAIPRALQHACSIICGVLTLYFVFTSQFHLILILPVVSYLPLRLLPKRGICSLLLCGAFLIFCELFWLEPKVYHVIRGPLMVIIMKLISLAFDLDIGPVKDVPGVLPYFGYMFCPGSCVFGPWTSFLDYEDIFKEPRWRLSWLKDLLVNLSFAFFFMFFSTCGVNYFIPSTQWVWLKAYRDAVAFRFSHYFVSYTSELTLLLAGYTKLRQGDDLAVARPRHIEIPRSLIQVVVYWNLPMHYWLKIYVFNTTLRLGNFLAILSTYAASSLLHGLNFQLAAVLLSLGLYSYVEFMLRKKLANVFSACVLARPCKPDCSHTNKWKEPGVLGVNFFFMCLSIFHLAYLGVMFQDTDSSDTGYSYQHTLNEWYKLGYLSHFVAFFTYIVYFLI